MRLSERLAAFLGFPRRRDRRNTLICMRLEQMMMRHPEQENGRVCARCGERVGIYPSGQAVLEADPTTEVVCSACVPPAGQPYAPGAFAESTQARMRR